MINKHLVNGLAIAAVVLIYLWQRSRANRTLAPMAA
jgi:hypothetical protein